MISQTFTRAAARQTLRSRAATQSKHTQRNYATNESPSQESRGSQRGLLVAAALAVPAAYYFMTKRDTTKTGDIRGESHGANQEYKKGAEGNN